MPAAWNDRPAFGALLRDKRNARNLTQEQLSYRADLSTRHISFLETGRSNPSRESVLALGEALGLPLRDRNLMLEAAGYSSEFSARALTDPERSYVRSLLASLLERHEPYPCYVVDHCWNVQMRNEAAERTLAWFLEDGPDEEGMNLLRLLFDPDGLRPWTVNFEEVAASLLGRLETEVALRPGTEALDVLLDDLRRQVPDALRGPGSTVTDTGADRPVLPIHLRRDDTELRLFSMIMTIGAPRDVTLEELRVETFFPADPASQALLKRAAG